MIINIMCGVLAAVYFAIFFWIVKDIRHYERMQREFWRNVKERGNGKEI